MAKYVIERTVPSAGRLSPADLQKLAAESNAAREGMTGDIHQVHAIIDPVTADK